MHCITPIITQGTRGTESDTMTKSYTINHIPLAIYEWNTIYSTMYMCPF